MALPDDKRPGKRGAVACLPAARSHEEPDPGGFRCISTKTDPEHSGPFVVQESGVALLDDKRPEKELQFRDPSSTGPRGTRPRWFQVHIYKKPVPEHSGPYIFQWRWGGVAGWQTTRIERYNFVCPSSTEP